MKTRKKLLCIMVSIAFCCVMFGIAATAASEPDSDPAVSESKATTESELNVYEDICPDCEGSGAYYVCEGCALTGVCETCGGSGLVDVRDTAESKYFASFWALIPPIIAIGLALITKEVYSSLFVGIVFGGLLSANIFKDGFSFTASIDCIINDGLISAVSGSAGIFIFLIFLGILVALVNKSGGSKAFGNWAVTHIKSRVGAMLATFVLGVLIFIDDYFNCLTVGSVMRPVTDSHNISRAKLAYIIDATAAPVCMIAPISSWAAAVALHAEEGQGLKLFIEAIPYNYYSLLTFVFIITITFLRIDYGPMKLHETNTILNGDLYTAGEKVDGEIQAHGNDRGKVIDLVLPVIILIAVCVFALVYVGGIFDGLSFVDAFSNTDPAIGLPWGGLITLIISIIYLMCRKVISFKEAMECIPEGFKAMVPAVIILTCATALNNVTYLLGAKYFVADLTNNAAAGLASFLPAIIFLVACGLSFSTGTSWGTFGILIPIVSAIFPADSKLLIIGISACLAGAVCGDHCSPISDTTIMSSAGAQCNHINHVNTQLPYVITVALISFVCYILAGFIQNAVIMLAIGTVLTVAALFVIKSVTLKTKKYKS